VGFMNEKERDALRQDIARHTKEFLRKGGKVMELHPGVSGVNDHIAMPFKINNVESRTNNALFGGASTKTKKGRT